MKRALRQLVRRRAKGRCEYCRLPQSCAPLVGFHIEHVIPKQHGGSDDRENLCFSCARCNLNKGPNLTGFDPVTHRLARLFNPRTERWSRHFGWDGQVLVGKTKTGRATIVVLDINNPRRVELRRRIHERDTG